MGKMFANIMNMNHIIMIIASTCNVCVQDKNLSGFRNQKFIAMNSFISTYVLIITANPCVYDSDL